MYDRYDCTFFQRNNTRQTYKHTHKKDPHERRIKTTSPSSESMQSANLISVKFLSVANTFPNTAHVLGVRLCVDRSSVVRHLPPVCSKLVKEKILKIHIFLYIYTLNLCTSHRNFIVKVKVVSCLQLAYTSYSYNAVE